MTNAYVFQAALLCEECGFAVRKRLDLPRYDFRRDDSNQYPQGPYEDGGGEADCPQHCDHCGMFLENPLTNNGENYVREAIGNAERETIPGRIAPCIEEWRNHYSYLWE